MKQKQIGEYRPRYPKKAVKGMTLAAAALLTIGSTLGCRVSNPEPQIDGAIAIDDPTPGIEETCQTEPMTTGMIEIAPTPGVEETLPPEELHTDGIVVPEEIPTEEPEELQLMGDVAVFEP